MIDRRQQRKIWKSHQTQPLQMKRVQKWFEGRSWSVSAKQKETWTQLKAGKDGLLCLPTGSGKTFASLFGALIRSSSLDAKLDRSPGLRILYICPLKSLATDIVKSISEVCEDLLPHYRVDARTGDSKSSRKQSFKQQLPEILVTTPESLALLLSYKDSDFLFKDLSTFICDEWHDLAQSKRGVLLGLSWAYLQKKYPIANVCAMSATVANPSEALSFLSQKEDAFLIRYEKTKRIDVSLLTPKNPKALPWTGYLGIRNLTSVLDHLDLSKTNLMFCNTRSQAEIWYSSLRNKLPDYAGQLAMHHGSLSVEERARVERGLKQGSLKLVVSTSSLDLGVDFEKIHRVYQVGSPKAVNRLIQRAGRSQHTPKGTPAITLVPSHVWDLMDFIALRQAHSGSKLEAVKPPLDCVDVAAQVLLLLSCSEPQPVPSMYQLFSESPFFPNFNKKLWESLKNYLSHGGSALTAYPEYQKLKVEQDCFELKEPKTANLYRMNLGTITADASLIVKKTTGKVLGTVEESFLQGLPKGTSFQFAGGYYAIEKIADTFAVVKPAGKKDSSIPRWVGGTLPYSEVLKNEVRLVFEAIKEKNSFKNLPAALANALKIQNRVSSVPGVNQLLVEFLRQENSQAVFVYPFLGKKTNQAIAVVLSRRLIDLGLKGPWDILSNDYGMALVTVEKRTLDLPIKDLFKAEGVREDLLAGLDLTGLEKMHFREISRVSMMTYQNYPGKRKSGNQLRVSSNLLFDVLKRFEPEHVFLSQDRGEILKHQIDLEEVKDFFLKAESKFEIDLQVVDKLSPLGLPIWCERFNQTSMTGGSLEEQVTAIVESWQ